MRHLSVIFFLLAALLAGCAVTMPPASTPQEATPVLGLALSPATQSPLPAEDETGGVRLSVRWPQYAAQQLTASTVAIDFELLNAQSVVVATASVTRPASDAQMTRIPSGAYTLSAKARAADRVVTAQASAPVQVVPNRLASVPLTLVVMNAPTVTGLSRSVVPAGGSFWIFGTNLLPPANGTYSVMVDGQAVPGATLQPGTTAIAVTSAPPWLTTNSHVTVSVDGIAAAGAPSLAVRVIDHVGITPAIATMSAGSSQTFQFHAYLDGAGSQEVTEDLRFDARLSDLSPDFNPNTGMPPFVLNGKTVSTSATGSFTLQITEEGKIATMGIEVVAPVPSPGATPYDPANPGGPPGGSGGGSGPFP